MEHLGLERITSRSMNSPIIASLTVITLHTSKSILTLLSRDRRETAGRQNRAVGREVDVGEVGGDFRRPWA